MWLHWTHLFLIFLLLLFVDINHNDDSVAVDRHRFYDADVYDDK